MSVDCDMGGESPGTVLGISGDQPTDALPQLPAANPLGAVEVDGAPNEDGTYEIEEVVSARWSKRHNDYLVKLKW